ncbi:MAG TPA: hypothetical protein VMN04_10870 [Thermoanaerobaculia bacterium]|nr:hypothetical protein [Thermoanaerobaculia bacterium]
MEFFPGESVAVAPGAAVYSGHAEIIGRAALPRARIVGARKYMVTPSGDWFYAQPVAGPDDVLVGWIREQDLAALGY